MDATGRTTSWVCVLLFGLLLAPAAGVAETPERGEDISDETAKEVLQLMRKGKKAYGQEKYQKAYDLFEEAYGKWPRPAIVVRLGKTAEKLGKTRQAIDHYQTFLDEKPDADITSKIEKRLADLKKNVKATVFLTTEPEGATVVDQGDSDRQIGKTPVEVQVKPGEHTWEIRHEGYRTKSRTIEVSGGQMRKLVVELDELGSEPALTDQGESDADDEAATPDDRTEQSGNAMATWGWGTSATGLAGIGVGVLFSALQGRAVNQVNTFDRGTSGATRQDLASLKDRAQSRHRVALVAYSAGGALLATGVGLLAHHNLGGGSDGRADARIGPRFGVDRNGGWAGFRIDF